MKKYFLLIISILLLTGCGDKGGFEADYNGEFDNKGNAINNSGDINTNGNTGNNDTEEVKLKDIDVEWCRLYNPNGFNTITCEFSNPNDIDVDISYDVVFYKDGKEVGRSETLSYASFSPKHKGLAWANYGLPDEKDVDEIKVENMHVSKAYYKSIDAKIEHIGITGTEDYFKIRYDEKPTIGYLFFFLYKDSNKNGKCDPEELNVTDIEYTDGIEDTVSVDTNVVGSKYGIDYDSYEIFYNAYTEKK